MGHRGPPPKATALRLLNGNGAKRPLAEHEPHPDRGRPRCAAWLPGEAKKVWRRVGGDLGRMGVLTIADGDVVIAYALTYSRWKAAVEFLQKHGEMYPIRDGNNQIKCMQQFPQVAIARNPLLVLRAYQQEFGLTPASRSRISLPAENPNIGDAARWLG